MSTQQSIRDYHLSSKWSREFVHVAIAVKLTSWKFYQVLRIHEKKMRRSQIIRTYQIGEKYYTIDATAVENPLH